MSIYTTPLQFGYFLALAMTLLLWYRGFREERLSDKLLGSVMLLLALQMQDYTFGFSGINFLWEELNGFPRGVSLLFGPVIYFYLRAQVNREFRIGKKHLWHLMPWLSFFIFQLIFFLQGKYAVQKWQSSIGFVYLGYVNSLVLWASYLFYFYHSIRLYQAYRQWAIHQFSDQEIISFKWFRNFIYLMIAGIVFMQVMFMLDKIFDWDFYQDWWWNLGLVVITFYAGIQGYAQVQPGRISFSISPVNDSLIREIDHDDQLADWKIKIEGLMVDQKPYLEPTLTLRDLANLLKTNSTTLSAAINKNFGKNFNDFINGYRVEEFIQRVNHPDHMDYTLLAIAMDCGFNSKATFNRAFRKVTGKSPNQVKKDL
jgi:AraC-like DNA-binding protein